MRYEETVKIQLQKLINSGIINPDKVPELDLYIDQAETFFSRQLEDIDSQTAHRLLTKSMINSYAKNNLVARPDGKKYTRDHMMMILMTAYLKGIFKVDEIEYLMKPLVENYRSDFDEKIDSELVYRTVCDANADFAEKLAEDTDRIIASIKKSYRENDFDDDERMEAFALILSLTMRADMEKYLAARLMEKYFIEPAKEKPEKIKKQKK